MKSIETERLILHLETEGDFEAIYNMLAQIYPPENSPAREGLQDEQNFYLLMRKGMFGGLFGRWIIKQKTNGTFIGLGMLVPHLCTPEETTAMHGSNSQHRIFEVEIGWALARPYRKLGYGTETARALLKYAFDDIGLIRVIGITDTENSESIQMMQRLGMKTLTLSDSTKVLGWITTDQPINQSQNSGMK
jgi:RimJ/RimL family protein N-acetyltransferase